MNENEIICTERTKLEFTMEKTKLEFTTENYVPDTSEFYLYDMKGILIETNQDLCDCNDEECPGCFTPCDECKSNKCGHMCRVYRTWRYGKVEINDGAVERGITAEDLEMLMY